MQQDANHREETETSSSRHRNSFGRRLDSNDSDSFLGEQRSGFIGSACIRDEYIHVLNRADQRGRDDSQFAGISYDDDLLRLLDHGAKGKCFVRFVGGGSSIGVDTGHAEKKLIEKAVTEEIDSRSPDQRKRPWPVNITARQMYLKTGHVAELHADVNGIGDDGDIAPMTHAPRHPSGG